MRPEDFKRWRVQLGATQASVAQLFRVNRATIQNWEAGRTRIPEAAESLWLRQAQRWRQRPEYGPVTLHYYAGPKNILTSTNSRIEPFPTNDAALRRARDLAKQTDLHFIGVIDDNDEPIWMGDQVRTEIQVMERRENRTRTPEEVEAIHRAIREIQDKIKALPDRDPTFTDKDLYDEYGLPK